MKVLIAFILALALILGFFVVRAGGIDAFVAEVDAKTEEVLDWFGGSSMPEGANVQVPGERIYFTAPKGWKIVKSNYSTILKENEDCLICISYNPTDESSGSFKKMVKRLGYYFAGDASSECNAFIRNQDIKIVSSKETTIGGYKCLSFTGTIWAVGDWDCHVYGYAVKVDGVELLICGLVAPLEQDADMIERIDDLTEQVAKSIQTTK